ncbi:MAG: hypothetical protein ACUVUR_01325 [bacterium]
MFLDLEDVLAIRMAESRSSLLAPETPGWTELLQKTGLNQESYRQRIDRLHHAGLIRSFHLTLVVPPLLGGNWVWAGMLARTNQPLEQANNIKSRLPFVTEIFFNSCLPGNIGPNLALLFYSRDFETENRFIHSAAGLRDVEVFKIAEFSYPIALNLSREEEALVRFLASNPQSDASFIASAFGQNENWVRAQLERLLWTENNRTGVIRIQLSIDWSVCANFGHFHFLLETGHRPEQVAKLVADQNFELVFNGRPISGRYIGIEADVWGISDLLRRVDFLEKINGIRVAGVMGNREVSINSDWILKIIGA